ncbi:unnamed protein product [Paramecium octaurelia]|uniref:Uncharacterized protein n=1 Tax=Paramecium octaurelia TaxID=43137 RepID=A0A8S1V9R2_PAROT|nr:unnamed protein product [Paramecium octaurelia]
MSKLKCWIVLKFELETKCQLLNNETFYKIKQYKKQTSQKHQKRIKSIGTIQPFTQHN